MEITFSENFTTDLGKLGLIIYLSKADVIGNNTIIKSYDIDSLWYEDNNSISFSILNLAEDIDDGDAVDEIKVFYKVKNNPQENDIEAFTISGNDLKFCKYNNYFTINLPKSIAVIESVIKNSDIKFIEKESNPVGINCYNSDKYSKDSLVTKKSYLDLQRNNISTSNRCNYYINNVGKVVSTDISYKLYKKINLFFGDKKGDFEENGDVTYYVNGSSTVNIIGTTIYDLYRLVNSEYILEKENCIGDISEVLIEGLDNDPKYNIDQANKKITFKQGDLVEIMNSSFRGFITYKKPDGALATIYSNTITAISYLNWSIEYSTNFINPEDKVPVLLFDTSSGSTGWDPLNNTSIVNKITIYSESKISIDDVSLDSEEPEIFNEYFSHGKLIYEGFDFNTNLNKYSISFATKKSTRGEYLFWYPLDSYGRSTLVKNYIRLGNSVNSKVIEFYCVQRVKSKLSLYELSWREEEPIHIINTSTFEEEEIPDYTVDPNNPEVDQDEVNSNTSNFDFEDEEIPTVTSTSSVVTEEKVDTTTSSATTSNSGFFDPDLEDYTDESSKTPLIKVTNETITLRESVGVGSFMNFYIEGSILTYDKWEVVTDSNLIKFNTNSGNLISINNTNYDNFLRVYPGTNSRLEDLDLGSIRIKRRNRSGGCDNSYWKDVIYCHPDNDIVINFNLSGQNDSGWLIDSTTNFSCNQGRLYVFDRVNPLSQSFKIYTNTNITTGINEEGVSTVINPIETIYDGEDDSEKEIFEKYFELTVNQESNYNNSSGTIATITIKPKDNIEDPETDWCPKSKLDETKPVKVTFYDKKKNRKEIIYCVYRPRFDSPSIEIYDSDTKEKLEVLTLHKNESKSFYIVSKVGKTDSYDYCVINKDPSIYLSSNSGYGRKLTLDTNSNNWLAESKYTSYTLYSTDTEIKPLVLKRSANEYPSYTSYFFDWRNYLVEEEVSIPINIINIAESDTIQVLDNKKKRINTIELSYIGVYKFYVKSKNPYRIALSNSNIVDHIYIYNKTVSNVDKDLLLRDEGSFDLVTGKEFYLAFYGNEPNAFKVSEQTLLTTIRIIDLYSGSETILPIHRDYTTLDSNITLSPNNPIIILDSEENSKFKYISRLETNCTLKLLDYLKNDKTNFCYDITQELNLNSINLLSGYINSEFKMYAKDLDSVNTNKSFPMEPIGYISLGNLNVTSIEIPVYKIPEVPKFSVTSSDPGYYDNPESVALIIDDKNPQREVMVVKNEPGVFKVSIPKNEVKGSYIKFFYRNEGFDTELIPGADENTPPVKTIVADDGTLTIRLWSIDEKNYLIKLEPNHNYTEGSNFCIGFNELVIKSSVNISDFMSGVDSKQYKSLIPSYEKSFALYIDSNAERYY